MSSGLKPKLRACFLEDVGKVFPRMSFDDGSSSSRVKDHDVRRHKARKELKEKL